MIVKMRIFFNRYGYLLISAINLLFLPHGTCAQNLPADSISQPNTSSWIQNQYHAIRKAYRHDPTYLKNEANRLKIRLIGTIQAPSIEIHPKSDIEKTMLFDSEPLKYVGADIGWNIFAFGYSFGIDRKNNKNNNRVSFGTFTRFYSISAELIWLNNLRLSNLDNFLPEGENPYPEKIALDGAYFRSRSAQIGIYPNGKKMAYGNTINPVFRQLKNAGTMVFAFSYSDYSFKTNLKNIEIEENEWISEIGINELNLFKYEFGAGYSYNLVLNRHWVLFASDLVGLSAKHYTYEMLTDEAPTKKTTAGICNYFRTGACYYNRDYFIGTHILYENDLLSTSQFLFNKNNLVGAIYIGYKFKVDGFNRIASNLLGIGLK